MNGKKRRSKKERFENLLVLSFVVLVAIGVLYLTLPPTPGHIEGQVAGDVFTGVLIKGNISEKVEAVVKDDTNCKPTGQNGLTCIAILNDNRGQELNFKYTHDMRAEKCLASGDRVIVQPISFDSVTVTRI